jgi:Uma2 family endonuclease
MPVDITEKPVQLYGRPKIWTRAECRALADSGLLNYERLELVEGELISKMGKKRPHVNSLTLLTHLLATIFEPKRVNPEAPIDVAPEDNPTNEPEPDLIVLGCDPAQIVDRNPQPQEVLLVVEVAETTLSFDLRVKAALYARAGIADYWVLDILGRRMIVHREPHNGRYQSVVPYKSDESVAPLAAPNSPIRVADAFLS